jgi:hypothetical protein
MTRPAPLFRDPSVLTVLDPHPLTDEAGMHAGYLESNLSGETFIVARDSDRLERLAAFARDLPAVESVETCHNPTGTSSQIADHDLGVGDRQFDTIVYTKATTTWFGRSGDFQRLTPHLRSGGTLIGKTKWVPDSDRLDLEDIAVAGAFDFRSPEVYLRWTKAATALSDFAGGSTERARSDGGAVAAPGAMAGRPSVDRTRVDALQTQYPDDARADEFRPGWSWHTPLTEHVEERVAAIDGPVLNLCCGVNDLGDLRVDQLREWEAEDDDGEPEMQPTAANIQADATRLPLASNSVAAVITDPPWKVDVETRVRLFSEAVRVVEPGGRVIQNSWWIPHHPYAPLARLQPVVANVTDTSVGGPGGLSFLATYEVAEHPGHEHAPYTLADHYERAGVGGIRAYREQGKTHAAVETPARDPRIMLAAIECPMCEEATRYSPRTLRGRPLYECYGCGFRHDAGDLLE